MFKHVEVIDESKEETIVHVDVHEEEIVTIDIVDETTQTSETNVDENIISEIVDDSEQDNALSSKPFPVDNLKKFKCKMCDFASESKSDLKNHKKTIHNWCFLCFSSFMCQENLKDHFLKVHSKIEAELDLALGKAPRQDFI